MKKLAGALMLLVLAIGASNGAHAGGAMSFERLVSVTYARYMPLKGMDDAAILPHESLTALKKIFTDDLAAAIFEDSQCVHKTGELCALDFDILFASQDPQPRELNVTSTGAHNADVCFRDQSPARRCMQVAGIAGPGGARIRDIKYDDGVTLRSVLKLR
jgi:hypothetical protein